MTHRRPLTELAQQAVGEILSAGDRVIDATIGNGHDTVFLASRVAPGGHVIGFDVQPGALAATGARLRASGLTEVVTLLQCGHEQMAAQVPAAWPGGVAAAMFNLGYLPGGDKSLITRTDTTVSALGQALGLLRVGGLISLIVYRGHRGGDSEAQGIDTWIGRLGDDCRVTCHESPGPLLYLIRRLR